MFCCGIYSFGYAFEIMRGDPSWTFSWVKVEKIGISFIAALLLWLALEFTGKVKYLKAWFFILMFGSSVFFLISVLTNDIHHLYYTYIKINDSGPFQTADLGTGFLYNAQVLLVSCMFIISAVIYIQYYIRGAPIFRKQTLLMIIATFGIIIEFSLYLFGFIPWNIDAGPMIITINGCISAFAIFRAGLLDISPIARDKVFESMKEGVIVTDLSNVITDFNPASQSFLPKLSRDWICNNLFEIMPQFKIYSKNDSMSETKPFIFENNEGTQFYEIREVPVMAKPSKKIGTAWYMRQITEQYKLMEKLKNYAEKDELTGIWNRRKWIEMAKIEFVRAVRYKRSISIMLIDIDHFKVINDTMGHEIGDKVLNSFTNTISSELRESDVFGRLGGEEFAIILPETNKEKATVVSKRLLYTISNKVMDFKDKKLTITISAGIAVCENGTVTSLEEFIIKADKALYEAKNSGRNRVCFADL